MYAEVNSTTPHDDSVAVVHHNVSTMSMNAGGRLRLMLLARHSHPSTDASGHLDASLQGNPLYLATFSTLPVPSGWLNDFGQPNVSVHFPFRIPVLNVLSDHPMEITRLTWVQGVEACLLTHQPILADRVNNSRSASTLMLPPWLMPRPCRYDADFYDCCSGVLRSNGQF